MKKHLDLPPLTNRQLEIINGSLLGDGSLSCYKKYHHNWVFTKTQSKFDNKLIDKIKYIKFHCDEMPQHSSKISERIIKNFQSSFTLKKPEYYRYAFRTYAHPVWTELAKKWYARDSDGNFVSNKINHIIKIIPRDLKLTPLTACIWFMDDGFNYPKDGNAFLETQGFSVEDVEFLVLRLREDLGIQSKMRLETRGKLPIIYIGIKSWKDFIELIKPHVKWDCFQYKISTEEYKKIHKSGENHPLAKLNDGQVREIFKLYNEGWSQKALSQKFNTTCISNILNGKLWSHLGILIKPKSNHMKSHLKKEQKDESIELQKLNLSHKKIGEIIGVSQSTVSRVISRLLHR